MSDRKPMRWCAFPVTFFFLVDSEDAAGIAGAGLLEAIKTAHMDLPAGTVCVYSVEAARETNPLERDTIARVLTMERVVHHQRGDKLKVV